jgi:hypothetical protein
VLKLVWINLELKRRRKEQVWVVRGLENAPELVANMQSFPVCTGHPRAVALPP